MDVHVDGMVYVFIEYLSVLGGKVKSYDDKEVLKVSGVRQTIVIDLFKLLLVFQLLGGVVVIVDNIWSVFQGCKKLKVVWDNGSNEIYDSAQYKKELQETVYKSAKVVRSEGDVDSVFAKNSKI